MSADYRARLIEARRLARIEYGVVIPSKSTEKVAVEPELFGKKSTGIAAADKQKSTIVVDKRARSPDSLGNGSSISLEERLQRIEEEQRKIRRHLQETMQNSFEPVFTEQLDSSQSTNLTSLFDSSTSLWRECSSDDIKHIVGDVKGLKSPISPTGPLGAGMISVASADLSGDVISPLKASHSEDHSSTSSDHSQITKEDGVTNKMGEDELRDARCDGVRPLQKHDEPWFVDSGEVRPSQEYSENHSQDQVVKPLDVKHLPVSERPLSRPDDDQSEVRSLSKCSENPSQDQVVKQLDNEHLPVDERPLFCPDDDQGVSSLVEKPPLIRHCFSIEAPIPDDQFVGVVEVPYGPAGEIVEIHVEKGTFRNLRHSHIIVHQFPRSFVDAVIGQSYQGQNAEYYLIKAGTTVGCFPTWGQAVPFIDGVSQVVHKKHRTFNGMKKYLHSVSASERYTKENIASFVWSS